MALSNGHFSRQAAVSVSGGDFQLFATAAGHRAPLWAVFVNQAVIIKGVKTQPEN